MAAISALLLISRVVTAMMSLEAKLFALSLLWVNLYQLQPYLVAKRRCSGHWLVQYGAMAAYYIPTPLAFYAASALCYSTSHVSESTPMLLFGILFIKDENGTEISRTEPHRFFIFNPIESAFSCPTLPFSLSHFRCFVFQM